MMLSALILAQGSGPVLATGPFLHYPYVQIGRPERVANELTLMWQAPIERGRWEVRYQSAKGIITNLAEFNRVDTTVPGFLNFHTELTSLAPGKPFNYEVWKDGNKVFEAKAKAPVQPKQKWRLVAFGDCGRGTAEQAKVSFQASKVNGDAVLVTGDIVYDLGRVSEYETKFWTYYNGSATSPERGSQMMRSIPFLPVLGNHDMASNDLTRYPDGLAYFYFYRVPLNGPKLAPDSPLTPNAKGTGLNNFLSASGENYPQTANYSFDYGNAHFVVLNSNPNVDWTTPQLVEWLKKDLDNADPKKWRIVSYHHPEFQSSKVHATDRWMRVLSDLYVKCKVDLVLNGHVHNYQRTKPIDFSFKPLLSSSLNANDWKVDQAFNGSTVTKTDGVIRIVTGGGGAPLYNPELEPTPDKWLPFTEKYHVQYSFSQIDFEGDKLNFKQIDLEGKLLDSFLLTRKPKN
jgi:hypothetical protein